MNNHTMARAMLERAEAILEEAHFLYERARWNLVVRRCQEAVELALKAVLLWAGVEVPRSHDVGPWLRREAHRYPAFFRNQIPRLASISRALRAERELSFYGDEATGVPAEELYSQDDAESKLRESREVLQICRNLLEGENS